MNDSFPTLQPLTLLPEASANGNGIPIAVEGRFSHIMVQVTGINSPPAGTITFQGTTEKPGAFAHPVSVGATSLTTGTPATTATASGLYLWPVAGLRQVRVVLSGYSGSGGISVSGVGFTDSGGGTGGGGTALGGGAVTGPLGPEGGVAVELLTGLNRTDDGPRVYEVLDGIVDVVEGDPAVVTRRLITHYQASKSASGANVLIAAPGAGLQIVVLAYSLDAEGTVTASFQDTSGTPVVLTPPRDLSLTGIIGVQRTSAAGRFLFACTSNKGLDLLLSAAVAVNIELEYLVRTG